MYILICPAAQMKRSGTARRHNEPGRTSERTPTTRSCLRTTMGGSPLCRRRGLGHEPVEIAAIDALDGEHQDRGRGVGMHLLYRSAHAPRERAASLDDHHHLL